ncbi:MAG: cell division protein DedD [Candidatus Malihini olakiniferum]
MASKFQNRLVGTIILVTFGLIILPGLLNGKKKHYEDDFTSIPLVPKLGDSSKKDSLLTLSQSLSSQPPEGAQQTMQSQPTQSDDRATQESPTSTPSSSSLPIEIGLPAATTRSVTPMSQPVVRPEVRQEISPTGQAYVIQLGALKNTAKVNEILAKLRLSGYRAYTVPSTPVVGQITRIYVGPDASKKKLQSALDALQQLSGLSGQVRNYTVHVKG